MPRPIDKSPRKPTGSVLLVGSSAELGGSDGGVLSSAGVRVRTARTGADALAQHRDAPADLVVLDLDLPDASAEQFCRAVRADDRLRHVSLLVLCGDAEGELRRAADCGANAHVVRPATGDALARHVLPLLAVSSRARYRVLAQVTAGADSARRSFFCTSENVSPSGMLLEAPQDLSPGQVIECAFFLPGKVRVTTRGRVVRRAGSAADRRFGVQFLDLPPDVGDALRHFVEEWRKGS